MKSKNVIMGLSATVALLVGVIIGDARVMKKQEENYNIVKGQRDLLASEIQKAVDMLEEER